jgi:ATP-dependent DNA helicase 2 subunit 2
MEDGDDGETLLLEAMKPKNGLSQPKSQTQRSNSQRLITQRMGMSVKHTTNVDDSDSETDSDVKQEGLFFPVADGGNEPGKIIGTTYPLADFQKNIAKGDLVSKAVEDLAWAIKEIITKPFGMRRSEEMVICMSVLRETALKVSAGFT